MRRLDIHVIVKSLLLLLLLSSCSDKGVFNFDDSTLDGIDPIVVGPDVDIDLNPDSEVSYDGLKAAVLETNCLGCHNSNRARGGIDLSSYESTLSATSESGKVVTVNDSSASTLYLEVFNGTMPPRSSLSEEQIALVKKWIDTGAKKSSAMTPHPSEPVEPEVDFKTLDVDYVNLKKFILQDKCLGCHKTDRAKAEVDLSTYETMFGMSFYFSTITEPGMPEQSALYTEVFKGNMPPRTKLSDDEIDYIRRWIAEGAIEEKPKLLPLSELKATYTNLFERVLKDQCIRCHNPDKARADVDLSSYSKMFDYSEYFSLVTKAGSPDDSALYTEVFKGNMPPRKKLSDEEIKFIRRWIAEGAIE